MTALLTLLAAAGLQAATPLPVPTGLYVERAADGSADCAARDARAFDIRWRAAGPPHPHSANQGEIRLRLHGTDRYFVLTGFSLEDDRLRLRGGQQNTVGREIDGITSGQLTGRFTLEADILAGGDLRLASARFAHRGEPEESLTGEPEPAAALNAFAWCGKPAE